MDRAEAPGLPGAVAPYALGGKLGHSRRPDGSCECLWRTLASAWQPFGTRDRAKGDKCRAIMVWLLWTNLKFLKTNKLKTTNDVRMKSVSLDHGVTGPKCTILGPGNSPNLVWFKVPEVFRKVLFKLSHGLHPFLHKSIVVAHTHASEFRAWRGTS